jgi:hypothetical protein
MTVTVYSAQQYDIKFFKETAARRWVGRWQAGEGGPTQGQTMICACSSPCTTNSTTIYNNIGPLATRC